MGHATAVVVEHRDGHLVAHLRPGEAAGREATGVHDLGLEHAAALLHPGRADHAQADRLRDLHALRAIDHLASVRGIRHDERETQGQQHGREAVGGAHVSFPRVTAVVRRTKPNLPRPPRPEVTGGQWRVQVRWVAWLA